MSADPASFPAWRSPQAYEALRSADPAVWAWEFARRGLTGVEAEPQTLPGKVLPDLRYAGPGPCGDRRPAVLWSWEADASLPVLSLRPCPPREGPALDLRTLDLPVLLVRSADGEQHVLVADGDRRLRFAVLEGDALAGPSLCYFRVGTTHGGAATLDSLRRLMHLQATGRLPSDPAPARDRSAKWLAALQAFDARRDGASQRDIACLLFGDRRVVEDWNGRSDYMRMRVQRLVRNADRWVRGGYRSLFGLATASVRAPAQVEVWRSARWITGLLLTALAAPDGAASWLWIV